MSADASSKHRESILRGGPTTEAHPARAAARAGRDVVFAAGGVLWRPRGDRKPHECREPRHLEIALVHRKRYDDWSLPKGKLDAGEALPTTAVREIREETGFECRLGRRVATVEYPLRDHTRKSVTYWSALVTGGEFVENSEVDAVEWLTPKAAQARTTYKLDAKVVKRFLTGPREYKSVLLVRHARAGDRLTWEGDDDLRPLDKLGRAQAEALIGQCRAFGAGRHVISADRVRCTQTVEPLAAELGVPVESEPLLSEEGYAADVAGARERFVRIVAEARPRRVPVVCSQGGVIPDLLDWLAERDGVAIDDSSTRKAGTWVLGFRDDALVWADYLASPLPLH